MRNAIFWVFLAGISKPQFTIKAKEIILSRDTDILFSPKLPSILDRFLHEDASYASTSYLGTGKYTANRNIIGVS